MNETMEWIFDADAHVTEPPDVWTSRISAKYGELCPRVERDDDGKDWWVVGGVRTAPPGLTAIAGWKDPLPATPQNLDEVDPAAYDAKARLAYLDREKIWSQVIYPNVGGFGSQTFLKLPDADLRIACVRAYNDWLIEWCSAEPSRLIPIMAIPFWDVPAAVAEVHRCFELGHKGVLFTGEPQRFGLSLIGDPSWNPLWSAIDETGLPISLHLGSGDFELTHLDARIAVHGMTPTWAWSSMDLYLKNANQVSDLLLSGVLPRFPGVKWISVESGMGWLPFVLEGIDRYFELYSVAKERPEFVEHPSDYFRRQMAVCYFYEELAPQKLIDDIGADNILFETDYPHPACLYGNIRETIEAGLGNVDPAVRKKILWQNAADLYGVDEPTASMSDHLAAAVGAP